MNQRSIVVTLGILIIVLIVIFWPFVRVHQIEAAFRKVSRNDTRSDVLNQMGNPWNDGKCGFIGGPSADCVEEFIYAHPYAPLLPEYWVISFNRDRRVIDSVYSTSP
jgi:hypothetical protein